MNTTSIYLFGGNTAPLPPVEPAAALPPSRLIYKSETTIIRHTTTRLEFIPRPRAKRPEPPAPAAEVKSFRRPALSEPRVVMVHLKSRAFEMNLDGETRRWNLVNPPADMPAECNGIARFFESFPESAEVHIYGPGPATGRMLYVGMALLQPRYADKAAESQRELAAKIDRNGLKWQWLGQDGLWNDAIAPITASSCVRWGFRIRQQPLKSQPKEPDPGEMSQEEQAAHIVRNGLTWEFYSPMSGEWHDGIEVYLILGLQGADSLVAAKSKDGYRIRLKPRANATA